MMKRHRLHRFLTMFLFTSTLAAAQTVTFPTGVDHVVVPFTDDHNHMVIQVGVNGTKPQPAILDTGAQGAVLNGDPVPEMQKYGITKTEDSEIRGVGGGGVGMKAVMAHDVTFEIGGAKLTGNDMAIVDRVMMGRLAQLVVGQSIFRNFVVQVDWEKHELTLYDPAKFKYTGKGTEVPVEFDDGGRPYLHAKANLADAKDVPVKLVIDTGAMHNLSLIYGSSPQIKIPTGEKVVFGRGASGEVRGYIDTIPSLVLGTYTITNIPTMYPDESLGSAASSFGQQGNLGGGILRRFTVVYDYPHSRIFIEPNSQFGDPFRQPGPRPNSAPVPKPAN